MRSPLTKLAVAASIIVACVIGLSLWTGTQSGIALADVLAHVEQAKTYRIKGSFTQNGQTTAGKPYHVESRWTDIWSKEFGGKSIVEGQDPNGVWTPVQEFHTSLQKKISVSIKHPAKQYVRRTLGDSQIQGDREPDPTLQPEALIKKIMACKYETLGRSTINGVEVEGFRTSDPNCRTGIPQSRMFFKDPRVDLKVWVDVKTRLPVRHDDLADGLDKSGNTMSDRFVTDFEWDIPLTAADFDPPPVPDGYKVLVNPPPWKLSSKAMKGLRRCVELCGSYLDISDNSRVKGALTLAFEKSETPAALQLKEEMKGLTEDEKANRLDEAAQPIDGAVLFYSRLVQQRHDPAYYGKTVTPKDSDKVLMRWKVSDNEYCVVYGDLHAETVSSEKLAELETALPK